MRKFLLPLMAIMMIFTFQMNGQSSTETKRKDPKFGKGINFMAADSSFSSKFHLRMQNLFVATFDEASEDWSSQFFLRRARLKFDGHALNPNLKYKVELGLSNRDISVNSEDGNTREAARIVLDAVVKWKFSKNWSLWVGQTKLPGNRERVISSANLQFVDRSLVNSRFNIDRDAGLQFKGSYKVGKTAIVNPTFAITQGEGRNITSNNYGGYSYTAHVDFLPLGKFTKKGDYVGSDIYREEKPKLAIGLAFNLNDRAVRQGGQLGSFVYDSTGLAYAENSLTAFIADLMFKYQGFSVAAEFATKSAEKKIEGLSRGFRTGNGIVVQTGYLFKNNVELSARYTSVRQDNRFSGINDEDEITLGFSKYIVGHSLKVQSDISRVTSPGASNGDIRFRAQLEFQF